MILQGRAPRGLFTDALVFDNIPHPFELPSDLKASRVEIRNCPAFRQLPERLLTGSIHIRGCPEFQIMPASVSCTGLHVEDCRTFETLPDNTSFSSLALTRCPAFSRLPNNFGCSDLSVIDCPITTLPDDIRVEQMLVIRTPDFPSLPSLKTWQINLSGCTNFREFRGAIESRDLNLTGCTAFRWSDFVLLEVQRLNLRDCVQLTYLPDWIVVSESIDVANTQIRELPPGLKHCSLLWKGVRVDERIAFRPEEIRAEEILAERNAEKRRVMLERMGWEKFLGDVNHKIRHRDTDPGGERKLLEFTFSDGEAFVVLVVLCPSTQRRYFIRVPPWMRTCHQSAAWIAGFDDAADYEPVVET